MQRIKNRIRTGAVVLLVTGLTIGMCSGCGAQKVVSPDAITIEQDGAEVEAITISYGTEDTLELTAVVSPEDYTGELTWESNDAGVLKVKETEGNTCTLSILKPGDVKITVESGETSDSVKVTISKNQDHLTAAQVALTVNGREYSAEKINIVYAAMYYQFLDSYGSYASYYGLDTSTGLSGLEDQSCDYSDDGTWKGFFLDEAKAYLKENQALCDYADENNITLDDEELQSIDDQITAIEEQAEEKQYDTADHYIESLYGDGANVELYREFLTQTALANKAYNSYSDSLSFTEEELKEHYSTLGYSDDTDNDYNMVSMRHILIMAEADEDGNYSDEAIAAAHDKAEEIYEEWKAGEATEDSFAELADKYSEDSGSNTTGGLYEDIYQGEMVTGINDWLFGERKPGDTEIIDNNGSYVGTHIVYFVSEGQNYADYLSEQDLKDSTMSDWMTSLETDDYEPVEGNAYSQVGSF